LPHKVNNKVNNYLLPPIQFKSHKHGDSMLIEIASSKSDRMGDFPKDRLLSLNKARTKGPNGRRLPSTKIKKKVVIEDEKTSDANENIVTTTPLPAPGLGTIHPQDFDKIWFIRVPSITGEGEETSQPSDPVQPHPHNKPPHDREPGPPGHTTKSGQGPGKFPVHSLEEENESKAVERRDSDSGEEKSKKSKWKVPKNCNIL